MLSLICECKLGRKKKVNNVNLARVTKHWPGPPIRLPHVREKYAPVLTIILTLVCFLVYLLKSVHFLYIIFCGVSYFVFYFFFCQLLFVVLSSHLLWFSDVFSLIFCYSGIRLYFFFSETTSLIVGFTMSSICFPFFTVSLLLFTLFLFHFLYLFFHVSFFYCLFHAIFAV